MARGTSNSAVSYQKPAKRYALIAFGLFWCAITTAGAVFFYNESVVPARRSKSWVATPCEIVESRVVTEKDRRGTHYSIGLSYRYLVAGRSYVGTRYQFVTVGGDREAIAALVAQYPPGTKTTAFVDPTDPQQAVLKRGLPESLWWLWIMFGVFELLGIAVALAGLGAFRRRQ